MQYTVEEITTISQLTEALYNDPDYIINTLSFSSCLFEEMKQIVFEDINSVITLEEEAVCAVISSVAFFNWADRMKSKSTREVTLCFYWDSDVLGVDLMTLNSTKIGCTSWMSSRVVTAILLFLNTKGVGIRLHKPSMREIVQMVQSYLYPTYHNCHQPP